MTTVKATAAAGGSQGPRVRAVSNTARVTSASTTHIGASAGSM
jgi:hypothetical protein